MNQLCQLLLLENEPLYLAVTHSGWSIGNLANSYLGSTGNLSQLNHYQRQGEYLAEIEFLRSLPRDTLITALSDGGRLNAVLFESIPLHPPLNWGGLPSYRYFRQPTKETYFENLPVNKHAKWGVICSHPLVALFLLGRGFACVWQRDGEAQKFRHYVPLDTIARDRIPVHKRRELRDCDCRSLWEMIEYCPKTPSHFDQTTNLQVSWVKYANHLLSQDVPPNLAFDRATKKYGLSPSWQ